MKNKIFKKVILVALIVTMFATSAIGAFAEDAARNINDHLTIHYDFEGENYSDAFVDKAPAGKSNDKLTSSNGTTTVDFIFENTYRHDAEIGTIYTKPQDERNGNVHVKAAASEDTVEANTGDGTWFLRYCFNDDPGSENPTLIDFRDIARDKSLGRPLIMYYWVNDEDTSKQNTFKFILPSETSGQYTDHFVKLPQVYDFTNSPWMNIALVRTANDTKSFTYSIYLTYGDPETEADWADSLIGTVTGYYESAEGVSLWLNGEKNWRQAPGIEVDDLRYYNIALTTAEIATIIPTGHFADDDPIDYTPDNGATEGDGAANTTPADTTADTTADTASKDTTATTSAGTTADTNIEENKGCGSTIATSIGLVAFTGAVCSVATFKRKKKDDK